MFSDSANTYKRFSTWINSSDILALIAQIMIFLVALAVVLIFMIALFVVLDNTLTCDEVCQLDNLHQVVEDCAARGIYTLQECKAVAPQILSGEAK